MGPPTDTTTAAGSARLSHPARPDLTVAILGLGIAGLVVVAGCGPRATVVTGVVTLDGAAVAGASVQLFPVGGQGQPAGATTDDAGKFWAKVSPVPLRVLVSKRKFGGYVEDPRDPAGGKIAVVDEILPARYADLKTTPLTAEPRAGQTTTVKLTLTTAP
jgi:hypothetical protein